MKQHPFDRLVEIMKILRSPEGCPWDKSQTLESITENIIEESYEVIDSIHKEDFSKLKEETGDLLFQTIFISEIASEKEKFSIYDVIEDVISKLVERHPHVFGQKDKTVDEKTALVKWENSKKENQNPLEVVPNSFPTLLYIYKVIQKAKRKGILKLTEKDLLHRIKKVDTENLNIEKLMELLILSVSLLSLYDQRIEIKAKEKFKNFIKEFL